MRRIRRQSGAALLTVLIAMMLMSIMLFEFQYSAMVERKLAYNELNQMQAYYLAKAGARIGLLRVALYGRAKRSPALKNLGPGVEAGPFLEQIWKLPLPPFPPPTGTVEKMDKADRDAAEKAVEQTKIAEGMYTHVISSESNKINLNYLVLPANLRGTDRVNFSDQPKSLFEYVGKTLVNLLNNFIRDSQDPYQEYPDLRPEELVYNIMDWVNPGANSFAGGSKDAFYEQQKPPYKAKRNRFYSMEELKLVKGMTDDLYNKLRPHVTVYSYDGKINIDTASEKMYRALYPDFTEDDVKKILEERERRNGTWGSERSFVEFVTTTLGRSGFKTYFPNENDYPFTVASQSFLIESSGSLQRSNSTILKTIRIGVALTSGKGGTVDNTLNTAEACNRAPGRVWHPFMNGGAGACITAPTNDNECLNLGGGAFVVQGNQRCCIVPNTFRYCTAQGAGAGGGNPGAAGGAKAEANAMKILYWSES